MRRWLVLFLVTLFVGIVSFVVQATFLEFVSFAVALSALSVFTWSAVKFSLDTRLSKTQGGRVRRSYTKELHAIIFQHPPKR